MRGWAAGANGWKTGRDSFRAVAMASASLTGRITARMAQAAELAIRRKADCISLDLLGQAASAGVFRLPVADAADCALA